MLNIFDSIVTIQQTPRTWKYSKQKVNTKKCGAVDGIALSLDYILYSSPEYKKILVESVISAWDHTQREFKLAEPQYEFRVKTKKKKRIEKKKFLSHKQVSHVMGTIHRQRHLLPTHIKTVWSGWHFWHWHWLPSSFSLTLRLHKATRQNPTRPVLQFSFQIQLPTSCLLFYLALFIVIGIWSANGG